MLRKGWNFINRAGRDDKKVQVVEKYDFEK